MVRAIRKRSEERGRPTLVFPRVPPRPMYRRPQCPRCKSIRTKKPTPLNEAKALVAIAERHAEHMGNDPRAWKCKDCEFVFVVDSA